MPKPKHILVVDDDTSLNQLLEKFLSEEGYKVDVAIDGVNAQTLLQRNGYDVTVLDNYLPKMNGIDVLRYIKKENLSTKCIMITAVNEHVLAQEARSAGADAVLAKPFEVDRLMALIRRLSERGNI